MANVVNVNEMAKCLEAAKSNVKDVATVISLKDITVYFDISSIPVYNLLNVGKSVINKFENTINFCAEVGLINLQRNCRSCHKSLKLTLESRKDHATPVVFRCYNRRCKKTCFSIRQGSVFEESKLSLEQIIVILNLFSGHITAYEQIIFQGQLCSGCTDPER